MDTSQPFKWRHFQAEIILLCVRWLCWLLGASVQKKALTMAQPFFFLTMYASVGDVKVSCSMCLLPDF